MEYATAVGAIVAVDRGLIFSNVADSALAAVRHFLARKLKLDSEFFEAKFRKANLAINSYINGVARIRDGASAVVWGGNIEELNAAINEVERHLDESTPAALSKSVLELQSLLPVLAGVPPDLPRELEAAGLDIGSLTDGEGLKSHIDLVRSQISALREAVDGLRPSVGILQVDMSIVGEPPLIRRDMFAKLAALRIELEKSDVEGTQAFDRRGTIMTKNAGAVLGGHKGGGRSKHTRASNNLKSLQISGGESMSVSMAIMSPPALVRRESIPVEAADDIVEGNDPD
jgi:hypothetical protein